MQGKKIALFVCHDLTGLLMLNGVVPAIKEMGLTPVIFNTKNHRNRKFKVPTPPLVSAFNVLVLEEVILPFLESRKRENPVSLSYRQLAREYGAEYHEVADINAAGFVKQITEDENIAGGLSLRFLQVFNKEMISAIREKGFFWNLHGGLLGDYKGLLLPYRAIQQGEKEYGVTLHEITGGIDEGAIIDKGILPLDKTKPVLELYLDTVDVSVRIIPAALDNARQGLDLGAVAQPAGGEYYSNPTAEEFKAFMQDGIFFADRKTTAERISGAFTVAGTQENKDLTEAINRFIGTVGEGKEPVSSRKRA